MVCSGFPWWEWCFGVLGWEIKDITFLLLAYKYTLSIFLPLFISDITEIFHTRKHALNFSFRLVHMCDRWRKVLWNESKMKTKITFQLHSGLWLLLVGPSMDSYSVHLLDAWSQTGSTLLGLVHRCVEHRKSRMASNGKTCLCSFHGLKISQHISTNLINSDEIYFSNCEYDIKKFLFNEPHY